MPKGLFRAGSNVADAIELGAAAKAVFERRKLKCPECAVAPSETLADVARLYDLPLEELLGELNKVEVSSQDWADWAVRRLTYSPGGEERVRELVKRLAGKSEVRNSKSETK